MAVSCNHRISLHGCLCEAPVIDRRAPCGAPGLIDVPWCGQCSLLKQRDLAKA